MQLTIKFLILFALAFQLSCGGNSGGSGDDSVTDEPIVVGPLYPASGMPKIVGADEDHNFKDEKGDRFFPWGLNYTNTVAFGLIDDEPQSDIVWYRLEEDFVEMKAYSANAVRVHLQYNRFMLDQWTPDPQAFEMLDRLVDIAENNELYLIITGLCAYRKEDSPLWYDSLSDEERWNTQALFWKTLARKVGHRGAVFAYDLMNEPTVSVCGKTSASCDWLVGDPFGGFYFVQNITREPDLIYTETIAAWVHKLTHAIRSEDSHTLITVGNLPVYPLAFYADHLDFVSAHTYPKSGNLQESINYVLSGSKNKPLILGEVFSLYCSVEELGDFLFAIEGRYHGLFGHYQGETLEDLTAAGDIESKIWHDFLLFFMTKNPNTNSASSAEP